MGLIFNGKSSRDYGMIVESYPALNHGVRRGEAYTIAGRNGTFYTEDGTFDNYIQTYNVAVLEGQRRRADLRAADIAAWLMQPGFCRLEDSFEPEYYKMARFAGPLNIEQILGKVGRCTLEFDCRPERWLKSGEEQLGFIQYSGDVYNPTPFASKPLIEFYATGTAILSVNNVSFLSVSGLSSTTVVIDCDTGTIQDSQGNNLMAAVTFAKDYNELPTLAPGSNTVAIANAQAFEVTPRWWVL